MQDIIWAFSSTPPASTEADSNFAIHQKFGGGSLNLTRVQPTPAEPPPPLSPPPTPPSPPAPAPEPQPEESESDANAEDGAEGESGGGSAASFVHGVLCTVAFLLVIPFGALVARYAKVTDSPKAFRLHRLLQFAVGSCPPLSPSFPRSCFFTQLRSWRVHRGRHARVSIHGQPRLACSTQGKCFVVHLASELIFLAGGRCWHPAAVRRTVRDREVGPPYPGGEPHCRAQRVAGGPGRHDRPPRVFRDVARPRLGRPQHARVVRAAIREFCSAWAGELLTFFFESG